MHTCLEEGFAMQKKIGHNPGWQPWSNIPGSNFLGTMTLNFQQNTVSVFIPARTAINCLGFPVEHRLRCYMLYQINPRLQKSNFLTSWRINKFFQQSKFFSTKDCEAFKENFLPNCEESGGVLNLGLNAVALLVVWMNISWQSKARRKLTMWNFRFLVLYLQQISDSFHLNASFKFSSVLFLDSHLKRYTCRKFVLPPSEYPVWQSRSNTTISIRRDMNMVFHTHQDMFLAISWQVCYGFYGRYHDHSLVVMEITMITVWWLWSLL